MELIHDVPAWAIGPACVLGFVVPAMVGLWLVHRNIHQRLNVGETLIDNGVVGWFFSGSADDLWNYARADRSYYLGKLEPRSGYRVS